MRGPGSQPRTNDGTDFQSFDKTASRGDTENYSLYATRWQQTLPNAIARYGSRAGALHVHCEQIRNRSCNRHSDGDTLVNQILKCALVRRITPDLACHHTDSAEELQHVGNPGYQQALVSPAASAFVGRCEYSVHLSGTRESNDGHGCSGALVSQRVTLPNACITSSRA